MTEPIKKEVKANNEINIETSEIKEEPKKEEIKEIKSEIKEEPKKEKKVKTKKIKKEKRSDKEATDEFLEKMRKREKDFSIFNRISQFFFIKCNSIKRRKYSCRKTQKIRRSSPSSRSRSNKIL